jgi:hypothetical protein
MLPILSRLSKIASPPSFDDSMLFSFFQLDPLIALHLIRYSTTPNCGLLEAGEEIDVVVTMAPLSQVRAHCQPPSDKNCLKNKK